MMADPSCRSGRRARGAESAPSRFVGRKGGIEPARTASFAWSTATAKIIRRSLGVEESHRSVCSRKSVGADSGQNTEGTEASFKPVRQ